MYNEIIGVCPETGKTVKIVCYSIHFYIIRGGIDTLDRQHKTWGWGALAIGSLELAKRIWKEYLLSRPTTHWKDGF